MDDPEGIGAGTAVTFKACPYTGEWSKERSLELLGPELMADIAARVAAAPPPSPELIATLRRAFASVPRSIGTDER